jgi:hypothetical protein
VASCGGIISIISKPTCKGDHAAGGGDALGVELQAGKGGVHVFHGGLPVGFVRVNARPPAAGLTLPQRRVRAHGRRDWPGA